MNEQQKREALLPCPFCGQVPTLVQHGEIVGIVCGEGSECDRSGLGMAFLPADRETAIACWNRRASQPAQPTTEDSSAVPAQTQAEGITDAQVEAIATYAATAPTLTDKEMREICDVRGWKDGDPLKFRDIALVFWAEGCAAMHRQLSTTPAPEEAAEREPGFVKPDNDRQVFFYEQDFYALSNFSAFTLFWKGRTFATSEQAYHWEKFPGGNCVDLRRDIQFAPSAHEAFKIAERNKDRRRADWDDVKVDIMREILRAKVEQHEYVRRKLLATADRELIEDSWRDDFWGWGPDRDGQNMLGKLWMGIRAEFRNQRQSSNE